MAVSDRHPTHTPSPSEVTVGGSVREVREAQKPKALEAMLTRPDGKFTERSVVHPKKAIMPMLRTACGRATASSELQRPKVPSPTAVRLFGSVMAVSEVQPEKA